MTHPTDLDAAISSAQDISSAFSDRLGRPLTDEERNFVSHLFADSRIAAQSWAWMERFGELAASDGAVDLTRWGQAFGAGYQEMFAPEEALADIAATEGMGEGDAIAIRAYRRAGDLDTRFRFKLYHREQAVPLADILAILEPMGLRALIEEGFPIRPAGEREIWVHEFLVDDPLGAELLLGDVGSQFETAFLAIWSGEAENDGFNRLVLELGAHWREAALVRALARFRQQSRMDGSQRTQIRALTEHAHITRLLLELFRVKFDPDSGEDLDQRVVSAADIARLIEEQLQLVPSLEDDRVLRRIYQLILATKRTNFFQADETGRPKRAIALKIASREIADLPEPRPYREIFVSAPEVEGVHLRFGRVARGGLRWSDRRDDFRTEVLGLVKAQQVKNAVIVPVGAKGGFVVKGARPGDSEAGPRAYRMFLSAMLDVTDNLGSDGEPVPPPRLIAHDDPDPYLVVAADKGTARFSDLANQVSTSRGFWLGDAFASGGSAGYDHKAMGITARGAWEAVKRHFREIGKDIARESFTAVGVGDMSGDVFGNGMLLSRQTRLIAAFDHRDIFIDPDPDPAASWAERRRLFDLPSSSWQDYDPSVLSPGGAVFSRQSKSVRLSPEARAALGIEEEMLAPEILIQKVLRAPVELLYMGGIGTYVKSAHETHLDVSDKANDPVRVDGRDLRALIVGEGANLGFTQAARIEYARSGGRINTDAIDNSAGVDSSDLEVNIKILTTELEQGGQLSRADRDILLSEMTGEVAELVLANNHSQTLALSLLESESTDQLAEHAHFVAELEESGQLDRQVEGLPSAAEFDEMRVEGQALTRPELAVLMAYAKLDAFDQISDSAAPDDPWFETWLADYFPEPLADHRAAMRRHRLRREIVATRLANRIVDIGGATFPRRVRAATGANASAIVTAFAAADEIFGLSAAWGEIHRLDGRISSVAQTRLYQMVAAAFRTQTHAIAARLSAHPRSVEELVRAHQQSVAELIAAGSLPLSEEEERAYSERAEALERIGAPAQLARHVALLPHLGAAIVLAEIGSEQDRSPVDIARLHSEIGSRLGFYRLTHVADQLARGADPYEGLAVRRLKVDLRRGQEQLTRRILEVSTRGTEPAADVSAWVQAQQELVSAGLKSVERIERSAGSWSLAKLLVAASAILNFRD